MFAFFFFQNWFWDIYIADKAVCSAKYLQWIWNSSNKQKSIFPPCLLETVECLRWNRVHVEVLSSIDSTQYMLIFKRSSSCHPKKTRKSNKDGDFLSLPQVSWNIFLKFICLSLEALNSLSFKYTLPISQNLTNANIWPAFGISVFQFSIFSIYLFAGKLKSLRGI